ncbi:MAG TPA: DUF4244 domain-containing protein [Actinoplanes sp.]|jgi:hypothetical protein
MREPDPPHQPKENHVRKLIANFARLRTEAADAGMSTAEYAVGTLAAVAFAGVLLKVVTGSNVLSALTAVIDRALK